MGVRTARASKPGHDGPGRVGIIRLVGGCSWCASEELGCSSCDRELKRPCVADCRAWRCWVGDGPRQRMSTRNGFMKARANSWSTEETRFHRFVVLWSGQLGNSCEKEHEEKLFDFLLLYVVCRLGET